ncbi:hypothetical protein SBA5_500020 [Candidatus Sulfotelmatomonas gaucii]|uniref:Uncharacterized protein n=1 Tax=Candidatus Sulfuritelmatomonas gaucii TaxID=2043161 RepID=A0A2N9LRD1_9BACT|nr:hypothetical protein SBA5_500020 [Candidatus Sulfotelmatomonas gaucii]
MNMRDKWAGEMDDPVLGEALKHFKSSVDAWSEAAYRRPRIVDSRVRRGGWQLAAGWALGCALAVGSLVGGVFEHQHRQELAKIAAIKAAQKAAHERLVVAQSAAAAQQALAVQTTAKNTSAARHANDTDENLLAKVDKDISQQVPAAMEPLAQLMDDNESQ